MRSIILIESEERKKQHRDKICDVSKKDFGELSVAAVSENLIASAFTFLACNGGAEDIRHAATVLHELVAKEETKRSAS